MRESLALVFVHILFVFAASSLHVGSAGEPVARVAPEVARTLGLPATAMVCGGTTDSIAAFLAAGVTKPGQVGDGSEFLFGGCFFPLPMSTWTCSGTCV